MTHREVDNSRYTYRNWHTFNVVNAWKILWYIFEGIKGNKNVYDYKRKLAINIFMLIIIKDLFDQINIALQNQGNDALAIIWIYKS